MRQGQTIVIRLRVCVWVWAWLWAAKLLDSFQVVRKSALQTLKLADGNGNEDENCECSKVSQSEIVFGAAAGPKSSCNAHKTDTAVKKKTGAGLCER